MLYGYYCIISFNFSVRPRTRTGRPLSGVVRPATQSGRPGTMEQALRTSRTARTARPITSQSARSVRLGTASMLTEPDGPFIQLSRLNLGKYATQTNISKPLFEYIYYHENDIRHVSFSLFQNQIWLRIK